MSRRKFGVAPHKVFKPRHSLMKRYAARCQELEIEFNDSVTKMSEVMTRIRIDGVKDQLQRYYESQLSGLREKMNSYESAMTSMLEQQVSQLREDMKAQHQKSIQKMMDELDSKDRRLKLLIQENDQQRASQIRNLDKITKLTKELKDKERENEQLRQRIAAFEHLQGPEGEDESIPIQESES